MYATGSVNLGTLLNLPVPIALTGKRNAFYFAYFAFNSCLFCVLIFDLLEDSSYWLFTKMRVTQYMQATQSEPHKTSFDADNQNKHASFLESIRLCKYRVDIDKGWTG